MRKTLLLVFIHGFKGGDDTFGTFPEHLQALLSHALPQVDVVAITYPKFETRGELTECVARFRDWLENKVIDLEVAHQTPSPTIDPSVHTILIGHSMGGIVAAETLVLLAHDQPLPPTTASRSHPDPAPFPSTTTQKSATATSRPVPLSAAHPPDPLSPTSFMFPHVQGLLAFDTPFLGIAPGVIAHGAEGYSKKATNAYSALSGLATGLGWGANTEPSVTSSSSNSGGGSSTGKVAGALPAPSAAADAAAAPRWQSWGKYAMFAGAAGAVAAGGAAALYSQKEKLSAGWTWAYGHLEFVGCLYKGEELKKRLEKIGSIGDERGIGAANFYTLLGKGASEGYGVVEATSTLQDGSSMRTFCSLPRKVRESKGETPQPATGLRWFKAINDKAGDETWAHMSMFYPRDNPGFYALAERAKAVVTEWIDPGWYDSSDARTDGLGGGLALGEVGDGWEKPDHESEDVKEKERQKSVGLDWEGLGGVKDLDEDEDVKMRDEPRDHESTENLGDSIIVDVEQKPPVRA